MTDRELVDFYADQLIKILLGVEQEARLLRRWQDTAVPVIPDRMRTEAYVLARGVFHYADRARFLESRVE